MSGWLERFAYTDEFGRVVVSGMDEVAPQGAAGRRLAELVDEASGGLDPEKRYAEDPRWVGELELTLTEYLAGGLGDLEGDPELRELLDEAEGWYTDHDGEVPPEGLVRRYARLTFDRRLDVTRDGGLDAGATGGNAVTDGPRLDFRKILDAVGSARVYAAGCPMNDAREGLTGLAYELAGDSASRRAEVDERVAQRNLALRAEAAAGLDPSWSYAADPRWAVELRVLADSYARGDFDASEEGRELRDVLAEACDAYASGTMVVPEELMRRYVGLTYDSWHAL